MLEQVKIIALGGLDEDGRNCILVEINNDIFVIGCGIRFPDKTMPGIDYVIPDFSYLKAKKEQVRGYFLLNGHDDQIGALAYIYQDVPAPVYGSAVTLGMLKIFMKHVDMDPNMFDLHVVEPSSSFKVAGRLIQYFQTAHNIACSSGVAIQSAQGNIVFTNSFVVENNSSKNYLHDFRRIAQVSETAPTLVLMTESSYAERSGYTAPNYKLTPHIEQALRDAKGRVFISLFSVNCYNIDEVIALAVATRKRIIPYDEGSQRTLNEMQSTGQFVIPRDNYAPISDLNRYKDEDVIVLILGHGAKLFHKIALLASGESEGHFVTLKESDTFIVASPGNYNTEIEATDALDELYRAGVHVIALNKKQLLKMHASEEDLKMMISVFRPIYYIPVKGFYRDLLANAKVALSMGINLSHNNVFLLENGLSWVYDGKSPRLIDESIPHGDIMIDGIGVGDVSASVINDRQKLTEGLVVLSVTLGKQSHRIIAGPEVQIRGLVFMRDSDVIARDLGNLFVNAIQEEFAEGKTDMDDIRQSVYERCLRQIRRDSGKDPMVLPLIIEVKES